MIEVEKSVVIDQPIEMVFAFVTKPENDAQWYVGLESWDHTPGEPAGVGSTSQSKIRWLGIPIEVTWEVIGYAPPNRIEVKTIEGMANGEDLHPVQQAFRENHALQCGYCTPGMIISIASYLESNPNPDERQMREAISGNICRCTGYQQIVEAGLQAAKVLRGES